jgi:membrane fusion protein (multidrug efflux system)
MSGTATVDARMEAPAPARETSGRKRPSLECLALIGVALLAVIGRAFYGRYWWETGRFLESTGDSYVGGDVTVIAPRVSGFVAEVRVADNQRVRAGDRDDRAALAKAEAAVAAQEATLLNLDANRHLQEAVIAQGKADLAAASAEAARTRFDDTRYRQLSANQYASEQRFQQADADDKKASTAVDKAKANLEAAERRIAVIDTQKRQAEAARDQARAERDTAQINLGYTEIRAPIDGLVGNRSARTGSYAMPGAGLIALVPASGLWVDANVKESQLAQMKPGQIATIVADVLPDETFTGRVESLAPATGTKFSVLPPENATGNVTKIVQRMPVRIRLDGEGGRLGRLRPCLSVTASVDRRVGAPESDAPVEPDGALAKRELASGLFNLMRNLGGAIGIAACATILNDRTNLHVLRLAEHLNTTNATMLATMRGIETRTTGVFSGDSDHGHAAAVKQLWTLAYREAQTMTYADAFVGITICFVLATALVPLMRKVGPPKGPTADAH